ncbi:hypothetical protein M758_11G066200 [Ceratodon purpureus]|nr:hypothetical protein M758_11G066200 [Ceratodon purpureus]
MRCWRSRKPTFIHAFCISTVIVLEQAAAESLLKFYPFQHSLGTRSEFPSHAYDLALLGKSCCKLVEPLLR